jgi:hypothetical protein
MTLYGQLLHTILYNDKLHENIVLSILLPKSENINEARFLTRIRTGKAILHFRLHVFLLPLRLPTL